MNCELLQQALNALLISAPLGHAVEDYEYRHRLIKDIEAELAKPEQEAYGYAKRLAEFIWEKHYKKESPDWTPLPDVLGVLTQIDNMTCGLEKANPKMPTKIFGPNLEQILNAAGFYRREWVGLTDDEVKSIINNLLEDDPTPLLTLADVIQERLREKNGG